ncbi:hypothetical protein [Marinoscillum pacificum]|uniref:hypothetical protein n=1 Tax=Marinoscillum pacificum TaxID=392723 RepID=UPI00215890D1|nr:hypothetical protein [Marinoscillum pacificum]
MTPEELKYQTLEIFQRNRQTPNAEFNESRFLDFLLTPPTSKNNIKNSFKGVKRYYRFFEDVELTFGICFTLSDQDRFYSVDQFVKKTKERIGKGRGNKMIIQRRLDQKKNYSIHIILTFIFLVVISFLRFHWTSVIVGVGYSTAMWWILSNELRTKQHDKKLYEIIKAQK